MFLLGLQELCLEKDSGPLCQTGTKSQPRWVIFFYPGSVLNDFTINTQQLNELKERRGTKAKLNEISEGSSFA